MNPNAKPEVPAKPPVDEKPSAFEGIDMSPARQANELYCDYKCRLWWIKRLVKFYLNGKPIWQSHMGTRRGSFSKA